MWKIDPIHKKILSQLFSDFSYEKDYQILDAGSGRTSLKFLTERFPSSKITAIIYPGDARKSSGIKESVVSDNFRLSEVDIHDYSQDMKFDVVLAHLLLGEATKFSEKPFAHMLESLFSIRTDFLVVVDILQDPSVDYPLLLRFFDKKGDIQKTIVGDKYIGFLVKFH